MKLKQRPNDFRVEELLRSDYLLGRGAYRVYRVTKRKRTSSEAAAMLGDLAGVPASRVAMAGLKDRQGVTQQYMTIEKGKRVSHRDELLGIETVGFAECELTSEDSEGNAFSIVVRDVRDAELERLRAATPLVREHGLPNYFDEQRFGNLRHKQGWIARDLARGEAELALRRLLTSVSDFDDDRWRSFKSGVYRSWGDWRRCRDLAGRFGRHHSIFEHLRREPDDFAGAFRYVATRERLIHLFAWQSHLWNRAVVLHLERALRPPDRETIRSLEGRLAFPKEALPSPPEWNGSFPLIGPHARGVEHADQRELYREVVEHEGLGLDELSIDGVPGFALKAEERALVVRPHELRVRPSEPDKLNTRRKSVQLRFSLPRGAYATLVVRRLFAGERASGASPG